ncbi:hypothetical protein [Demequina lutea]|uniref:Restriction endonuclease type II-like domain-containing protein n=1 Tax=Demequina lutea TaxID=431489 RepID=A0A7Y9Z851_9MICO|nr:hypothetical protein [Demequina lutea]NYI40582.1 hypothetical protein [Demequina lutea]
MSDYISRALVGDALAEWRELLRSRSTVSPLRNLASTQAPIIDMEKAHPSGLASLFAGRPTLLSTLMRDRDAFHAAAWRGGLILDEAEDVMAATGVWTAALVVGTASWDDTEVPLLMRAVSLERARENDLTITLRHQVELNPVFAAALRERSGPADLAARAQSTLEGKEFDPRPIWAEVRELAPLFGELEVKERLLLGGFEDQEQQLLDDLDALDAVIGASDVIAAIAGDVDARTILMEPLPRWPAADRDPFGERGIGDLDDGAFAIVDMAALGRSFVVDAPPGSNAVGMVAALVADAAASGRTAAVVGGSDAALDAVDAELVEQGIGDIAITGVSSAWHADARARLLASLTFDTPEVGEDELRRLGDELLRARAEVADRYEALHRPRRPWGVSAFETVQAIVRLTASEPQPVTTARLGSDAVAAIAEHGLSHVASSLVERIHGVGTELPQDQVAAPAEDAVVPWWHRVVASAEQGLQLDEALAVVVRGLPGLRADAVSAAAATGVDDAPSLEVWREQVLLFTDVQRTLDTFTPAVYHRSLVDLVTATAPRGIEMEETLPRRTRRALARRAAELLRPGRTKEPLHDRLTAAANESERWRAQCSAGGWPVVPDDFAVYASRMAKVDEAWVVLEPFLFDAAGLETPDATPWSELLSALHDLAEDIPGGLAMAPAAPASIDPVEDGFSELVSGLEERAASPEQIRVDLEFAWWASAFDAIVGADPRLIEQGALGSAVDSYVALDAEFASRRSQPLMRAAAEQRRKAIARHPEDARDLFATLMEASESSVRELRRDFGAVVAALRPVVVARADQVAHLLPPARCVDLLVLVGIESLATAQVVPALARATQVIVVADTVSATRSAVSDVASLLPHVHLSALPQARDPRVSAVLAGLGYERSVPVVPAPGQPVEGRGLTATTVDGVAQPVAGRHVVESTRAEVAAVVEAVERAALTVPRRTVAVVAGNALHAARIADALAERAPAVAERVVVTELGEATGLDVDEVVLALGYARDHRGVLPVDVGILGSATGAAAIAQALVAARTDVRVFAALDTHHLAAIAHSCADARGVDAVRGLIESSRRPAVPAERKAPGAADWLLADVARLLRAEGLAVRLRYGVGGQAIPMVVGGSHDRGYHVAVVTDEHPDGPRGSVRDRMRWQYARLEALGWTVVSLWTLDVFMDPARAAATVRAVVEGGGVGPIPELDADDDAEPQASDERDSGEDFFDHATLEPELETEPEPEVETEPETEPEPEPEVEPEPELEPEPEPEPAPERATVSPSEAWQPRKTPVKGVGRPLIPTRAWEDEDAAWGDRGPGSRDDEIKRDRPPHW